MEKLKVACIKTAYLWFAGFRDACCLHRAYFFCRRIIRMAKQIMIVIIILGTLLYHVSLANCQLSTNFYDSTCPNALSIVRSTFQSLAASDNVVSPSTLRMIIHDCFIQGCDGSILISSTTGNRAEREYVDNDIPQQAFNTVDSIKQALESSCPGVVSCADILVLAAQEAVRFLGGPSWQVSLGRRDSQTSLEANGNINIPQSNLNGDQLISLFQSKGLDVEDLVALSGAHTIGFSKCRQFSFRLTQAGDQNLDPSLARQLRGQCPPNGNPANVVPFDPSSPFGFDTSYFRTLQANRGLLLTDEALFLHPSTRDLVNQFASSPSQFFQAFVNSMIKMTSIGVLTGNQGEIRRVCTAINAS